MTTLPATFKVQVPSFSQNVTAVDTSIAFLIKYIGPATYVNGSSVVTAVDPSFDWDTAAAHDITFYLDATNSIKDDTTYSADGVGIGTAGVLSPGANYPLSTLVAACVASTNWRCTLMGALETELLYTHDGTVDNIIAVAADSDNGRACYTSEAGTLAYWDTSVGAGSFGESVVIGIEASGAAYGTFQSRHSHKTSLDTLERDISNIGDVDVQVQNRVNYIQKVTARVTDVDTTGTTLTVYAVKSDGSSRTLHSEPGAASTVVHTFTPDPVLMGLPGEHLIVRIESNTATTVPALSATGGWGTW